LLRRGGRVTKTATTGRDSPLSHGITASHRVTGKPSILLTGPRGIARHSQLPKLDVAGSIPVARSDGLELRDTRRFDRLPSANCPCSVRESLPTSPKPDQPGARRLSISYGASWEGLVPVAPAIALITQRSLVQIQPPQPGKTTGYGRRRRPVGFFVQRLARNHRSESGRRIQIIRRFTDILIHTVDSQTQTSRSRLRSGGRFRGRRYSVRCTTSRRAAFSRASSL
jgi:hypothetical protein